MAGYEASENVIIGNTCLYGATGGTLFVNGRAGERFAVRNSMADTVVEVCTPYAVCSMPVAVCCLQYAVRITVSSKRQDRMHRRREMNDCTRADYTH